MGLIDSVVDQAADMLGATGGSSVAKPDAASPLDFQPGDDLDALPDKPPILANGNAADSNHNAVNTPAPIEFVHYGFVHNEVTTYFAHPAFNNEPGKKPVGRAILFRDALEREALLLYGFITSTKAAHAEYKASFSGLGAITGTLNALAGTKPSTPDPDPGSLQFLLNDLSTAGTPINKSAIAYLPLHLAGINFHQVRADYKKFCTEKLEVAYLTRKADDSPLPGNPVQKLIDLSGVGNAANTVFGLLTKGMDIYLGMYLKLRAAYEPEIERVCHTSSLQIVRTYDTHTFAWWYKVPPAPPPAAAPPSGDSTPGWVKDLEKPVDDAGNTLKDAKKDVVDLAGEPTPDDPAPGEAAIEEIFACFGSGPSDDDTEGLQLFDANFGGLPSLGTTPPPKPKPPAPNVDKDKNAAAYCLAAFNTVLTGNPANTLPSPITFMVNTAAWASVEFLKTVYIKLCRTGATPITDQWLLDTAHEVIFDKIYSKLESTFTWFTKAKKAHVNVQGQSLGPEKLVDKGEEALKKKLGPYTDIVVKLAVQDFAARLRTLQAFAYDPIPDPPPTSPPPNPSLTLELFLGQCPLFLSLFVRNLTFPLWKMLFTDLVGKGNSVLETALKPVNSMLSDADDLVQRVKDAKNEFEQHGMEVGTGPSNAAKYYNIANRARKAGKVGGPAPKTDGYPGQSRIAASDKVDDIPPDDPDKAKSQRKDKWPNNVPA